MTTQREKGEILIGILIVDDSVMRKSMDQKNKIK